MSTISHIIFPEEKKIIQIIFDIFSTFFDCTELRWSSTQEPYSKIELSCKYLHQHEYFIFYITDSDQPLLKIDANAYGMSYQIGVRAEFLREQLMRLLVKEVKMKMRGIDSEKKVLDFLKKLLDELPYDDLQIISNNYLDDLKIDLFLGKPGAKVGLAFQVKSSTHYFHAIDKPVDPRVLVQERIIKPTHNPYAEYGINDVYNIVSQKGNIFFFQGDELIPAEQKIKNYIVTFMQKYYSVA